MKLKYLAVAACSLLCTAAAAVAAPLFSGNAHIAARIRQGDAHVMLLGDSLQNLTQGEYLRRWPVQKFVGQFVGENVGFNAGAFTSPAGHAWLPAAGMRLPDDPPGGDGYTGIAPGAVYHARFAAQQVGPEQNVNSNRAYAMQLRDNQPAHYHGGAWADRDDRPIHVDLLVYANPQGLESGLRFDVAGNSFTTPLASTPISTYAPTPQIRKYSLTFDAERWHPGRSLAATVRLQAGTTPTEGSNLIVLGSRFHTGESGFQMTNVAWGAKGIEYYLDPYNTTDDNLADFVTLTDSNVAMVWIGANNAGLLDKPQYKTKMLELIERYKGARPDMQFALVSTYDLGNPRIREYADALHEIATDDPAVLFLNMYEAAGSFEFLNQNYLADGVHPTPEGARYMADQLWGLIDAAASTVPEPSAAMVVALLTSLLALRRSPRDT